MEKDRAYWKNELETKMELYLNEYELNMYYEAHKTLTRFNDKKAIIQAEKMIKWAREITAIRMGLHLSDEEWNDLFKNL